MDENAINEWNERVQMQKAFELFIEDVAVALILSGGESIDLPDDVTRGNPRHSLLGMKIEYVKKLREICDLNMKANGRPNAVPKIHEPKWINRFEREQWEAERFESNRLYSGWYA